MSESRAEAHARQQLSRQVRLKAAGLCVQCGRPAAPSTRTEGKLSKYCAEHRDVNRERQKHRQKKYYYQNRQPELYIYKEAKSRCENPRNKNYKHYGGRGIQMRFSSFSEFFACLGPRPSPKHTVDRKNNDGHYEVGNVRWATWTEQRLNRRPTPRKTHCVRGHLLSGSNLYTKVLPKRGQVRRCRACNAINAAKLKARRHSGNEYRLFAICKSSKGNIDEHRQAGND